MRRASRHFPGAITSDEGRQLPLPLGNVLPSLSLILLSLGWMFRDGIALAVSAVTGCAALAYTASLAHLLVQLVDRARGWLPV